MSMKRDVAEYKKHMEREGKLEQIRLGKLDIMVIKALGRTGFRLVEQYIRTIDASNKVTNAVSDYTKKQHLEDYENQLEMLKAIYDEMQKPKVMIPMDDDKGD